MYKQKRSTYEIKIIYIISTYLLKLAANLNNDAVVDVCRSELEGKAAKIVSNIQLVVSQMKDSRRIAAEF